MDNNRIRKGLSYAIIIPTLIAVLNQPSLGVRRTDTNISRATTDKIYFETKINLLKENRQDQLALFLKSASVPQLENPATTTYNIPLSAENQKLVQSLCENTEVDPTLVYATMKRESDFNPNLVNENGDSGILQINEREIPTYAKFAGISLDRFSPFSISDSVKAFIGFYNGEKSMTNSSDKSTYEASVLGMWNRGVSGFISKVKNTGTVWYDYNQSIFGYRDKIRNFQTV